MEVNRKYPTAIALEIPSSWMLNPTDGERHKLFVANLIVCLARTKLRCDLRDVPWGADEAPRIARTGEVVFSFHSIGAVPNVWRLKEAPISPLYAFDQRGHSGWSQIAGDPVLQEKARAFDLQRSREVIAHYLDRFLRLNESKYPQSAEDEALPERFVFFPLQVQNDPVARFARINALDLLHEAAHLARANACHLLVKRHPFCGSQQIESALKELVAENPWVRATSGSVHRLIPAAQSVVVVNSGVGLEALIHGKPVYAAGTSEWLPAAIGLTDISGLAAAFESRQPQLSDQSMSYVGYLLCEYWVDAGDIQALERRVRACLDTYVDTGVGQTDLPALLSSVEDELLAERAYAGAVRRQIASLNSEVLARNSDSLDDHELIRRYRNLERSYADAEASRRDLEEKMRGMKKSVSWRLTSPLRSLSRILK